MDERVKFIARMLDGEAMSRLCEEFSISRKTGYKILKRYRDCGVEGLTDRSRRPYRHANQLPLQIETLIVRLKREKPTWGAPKIRERLARLYPDVHRPAISTVHAVLDRHGLVKRRKGRRHRARGTPLSMASQPNDLWCADYKGEFMLADRRYCYPLTITDFASRYLIACEALHSTKEASAFSVFVIRNSELPVRSGKIVSYGHTPTIAVIGERVFERIDDEGTVTLIGNFAVQMTMAVTVHAAMVAWHHVSIA